MFKVFKDGQLPTRGSKYSACVDLYAREDVVIGAGETVLVPLGVCIDFETFMDEYSGMLKPNGDTWLDFMASHYLQLMLRSSLSKELIIANGVGVVDLDYPDEIMMRVHNPIKNKYQVVEEKMSLQMITTHILGMLLPRFSDVKINKGDRVAQITLVEHKGYLFGVQSDEERKGGFGSTGQ